MGRSDLEVRPEHRRIMSLVAIGAAVENVKLRAGRLGFETKVCWFPDSGNPGLVAEIDVDRLPQTRVDPIEVAIERRRTNRRVRFRGPPLSQGELRTRRRPPALTDPTALV